MFFILADGWPKVKYYVDCIFAALKAVCLMPTRFHSSCDGSQCLPVDILVHFGYRLQTRSLKNWYACLTLLFLYFQSFFLLGLQENEILLNEFEKVSKCNIFQLLPL